MQPNARVILKQYRVSITRTRIFLLNLFLQSNEALTLQYFLNNPLHHLDRTTIFRTLNLFVEKKIILRIPAADGINNYLFLQAKDPVHSYFICRGCKKIVPMEMIVLPEIKLPDDFIYQNTEIKVSGLCSSCRSRKQNHLSSNHI